jgi:hypothetical protein
VLAWEDPGDVELPFDPEDELAAAIQQLVDGRG